MHMLNHSSFIFSGHYMVLTWQKQQKEKINFLLAENRLIITGFGVMPQQHKMVGFHCHMCVCNMCLCVVHI